MNLKRLEQAIRSIGFDWGISGREEYFQSVVLVPLIIIDNEYHLILEKRAEGIRQGGEICFPGGRIEEGDETLEVTALRETHEELGIPKEKIEIVGRLNTVVAALGAIIEAFVGIVNVKLSEIQVNPEEVEKVMVIPLQFFCDQEPEKFPLQLKVHPTYQDPETNEEIILFPAKELGIPERYWGPWGNFRYYTYLFRTEDGPLWGITAKLILDFIERLNIREDFNES